MDSVVENVDRTLLSISSRLLDGAIAKGPSVCLSVCHTREPRIDGSRYRNTGYSTRQSDVSRFLRPIFVVVNLGDHHERLVRKRPPSPCRKRTFDQ